MPTKPRAKQAINFDYYQRKEKQGKDLIDRLLLDMDDCNTDPNILVPLNSKVQMLEEELIGKSYILIGPAGSGKTSALLWACRGSSKLRVIKIDCRLYQSDAQFIQYLTMQIGCTISPLIDKRTVMDQSRIKFEQLNQLIAGKKQKFILIIKYAQKLAEQRKQLLLYTIFEWINNSDITQHLCLVLAARNFIFIDRLEKRIRSRINSEVILIGRPSPSKIVEIIVKRISYRIQRTEVKKEADMLKMLRKAVKENKELDKTLKTQYESSPEGISFYLNIMTYIITNDLYTVDKWAQLTQDQTNKLVSEGFKKYSQFISDIRRIGSKAFANCSMPELILMGLIRKNFLLQKDGSYHKPMNYSTLLSEYQIIKSRVQVEAVGNSFFYPPYMMQRAYYDLRDKGLIHFSNTDDSSIDKREMYCQFGPEDIEEFYKQMSQMPQFIKEVYGVIIDENSS